MPDIVPSLENLLVFRDKASNKILCVEAQNGHIERYFCEPSNNTLTNELFGVDKPIKS